MKIVLVVPRSGIETKLKALLNKKGKELRGRPTAFSRTRNRWRHITYPGRISLEETRGGLPHSPL